MAESISSKIRSKTRCPFSPFLFNILLDVAPAVNEPYQCSLYDLEGRLLRTMESSGSQATMQLNGLSKGVYMLEMVQDGRTAVKKVVVR